MKAAKHLPGIIFGVILAAFTVYCLLDTFVITRVFEVPETADTSSYTENSAATDGESSADTVITSETQTDAVTETEPVTQTAAPVITDNSYSDENIKIKIESHRYNETTVYVADIVVSSPEYLKTALARGVYGRNVTEKTSDAAERVGAILAINGDFYGARESGYVIRNGIIYRSRSRTATEILAVYSDGTFKVHNSADISAQQLLEDGAVNVFSFGPGLVSDGVVTVSKKYEVGVAMASNPRTAIAMITETHYMFVVSDGRTEDNEGLSLYELACFLRDFGAVTAYNLDGGGSSTMVFNGRIINNPTTNGDRISERSVSDIVYIGY